MNDSSRTDGAEPAPASDDRLGLIIDALPALVSFVDTRMRYRFVNAAYARWFGKDRTQIVGRHLEEVLGLEAFHAIEARARQALAGSVVRYEAEVPYRDGGTRFVEATYLPQRSAEDHIVGFVALVADITERTRLERFRAASVARADRLLTVTAALADAVSSTEVYEALVDRVSQAIGASSIGLWIVDDDEQVAHLARSRGYTDPVREQLERLPLELQPSLPVIDAMRHGQPIWISSQAALVAQYPHLRPVVSPGRAYRVSALPLGARGRIIGALGVTIEEESEFDDAERHFLLLIARYATQALERLRLLEAERRSRAKADTAARRLQVLASTSRTIAEAGLDLQSRLDSVASELGTTISSAVIITLIEPGEVLRPVAIHHPDRQAIETIRRLVHDAPVLVGQGLTGTVAATGKSLLVPHIDLQQLAASIPSAYHDFLHRHPVFALVCAPLRTRDRIIGTVTAARVREGQSFERDDLRLLEELAERAAVAIDNSRLYQETLDARGRAEHLYRFAQAVMAANRVEEVFEAAMDAIDHALGVGRVSILTTDARGVMRFRAWRGLSDAYRMAVDGHSPWEAEGPAPETIVVPDVEHDPRMAEYLPLFREEQIGALAFVPLVSAGRLLGKFMLYYKHPHSFAPHEVATARAMGNHLASVIARFAAVGELQETLRHNELFTGVLAHDLRTPLSAIMTAAQLLLMRHEGQSGPEGKPLSSILRSGQRMTAMIDQLLDFTRARSGGGIAIKPHMANLDALCLQAIGEVELAHPEWTLQFQAEGDPRGQWDGDRLLQVVSNLLANAGQHGIAEAGTRVRLDGTQRDQLTLTVHNRGAVPEAVLPHIFEPFRSTGHERRQPRGLGLGLFIVHEIVKAHGGSVDVSSSEEDGTSFVVRLPRYAPTPP
jgi:PAS domain S-box-containing protein